MKRLKVAIALLSLAGLASLPAYAVGTLAGTDISNKATVNYSLDGGATTISVDSPTVVNTVAEIIDITVVSQDASEIVVDSNSTQQVLTYLVTNTGNGIESVKLTTTNSTTDNFDPTLTVLYIDDGDGIFDPSKDTVYNGNNDPVLDANIPGSDSVIVFQASDIGTQADGSTADLSLTAESNTATGIAGEAFSGVGDNGVDAVIGTTGGAGTDSGTYLVTDLTVTADKTSSIADPFGGTTTVPGSVITYTITTTISGTGTATDFQVVDPIPADTTYSNDSLTLNGVQQSDALDSDPGDVGGTTANTVTVDIGDVSVSGADSVQTVVFSVTVN